MLTVTLYQTTGETSGPTPTVPSESTSGRGVAIIQMVAEDGTTPIGGACLELTGPISVQVCDNGPGDADLAVGSLELDSLPAGEYTFAVLPPDGYEPTGGPGAIAVAPDQFTTLVVTLSQTTGETSGPTPTMPSLPTPRPTEPAP
jgi:hypothetical protein